MTNANDLLWWDTGDGDCKLVVGEYSLIVYCDDEQWYFSRQRNRGPWQLSNVPHSNRGAAMQAAVDAAEAAGVDFGKAPRWRKCGAPPGVAAGGLSLIAWVFADFHWAVANDAADTLANGQAPTESLARTAAIAALRREVQKMIDTAKGELGV